VSESDPGMAETLFEFSSDATAVADGGVVDLKSDDGSQSPPPELDDRREGREVREARQLPGFHDVDPQRRKQVGEYHMGYMRSTIPYPLQECRRGAYLPSLGFEPIDG